MKPKIIVASRTLVEMLRSLLVRKVDTLRDFVGSSNSTLIKVISFLHTRDTLCEL